MLFMLWKWSVALTLVQAVACLGSYYLFGSVQVAGVFALIVPYVFLFFSSGGRGVREWEAIEDVYESAVTGTIATFILLNIWLAGPLWVSILATMTVGVILGLQTFNHASSAVYDHDGESPQMAWVVMPLGINLMVGSPILLRRWFRGLAAKHF